jgi:TPR repeat protein
MKRVEANDAASNGVLGNHYHLGRGGLQQDYARAIELYNRAAELGCSKAHNNLGGIYRRGGNLKKAKFHLEAAAMAGDETSRYNLGGLEAQSGNIERALKHWTIAASAGNYIAMHNLLIALKNHDISRESMDSTLVAYNNSCAEMRSEARDACIQLEMDTI